MKVLVTGGAGYIGSHVVKELGLSGKYDITVIDNLSTGFKQAVLFGRFFKYDLSDFKEIEKFLHKEKFDTIIHFAASIIVPESVSNPLKYYMNNTVNTTNLIKCAVNSGVKNFIFSSTAVVYGDPQKIPILETDPTIPINTYGMTKLMSEKVLIDTACAHKDFKYGVLRYFNVAGADIDGKIGQSFPNATHLIKVASEVVAGKRTQLSIFGNDFPTPDGTGIRDYIHVTDLALAHIALSDHLSDKGVSGIFNCGYGTGFSVKEVIETIKKVSGVDFPVKIEGRRAGDTATLIADNSKILSTLKWKPKYNDLSLICKTALNWEKNKSY